MMKKHSNKMLKSKPSPKDFKFNQSQLKWLEALESGKYKRCTTELCHIETDKDGQLNKISFCCLGVGADLLCNKKDIEDVPNGNYRKYEGEATYAPDTVIKRLRLNDEQGCIKVENIKGYRRDEETLAELNDNGMSFKKIAEFIRKNPTAVFKH